MTAKVELLPCPFCGSTDALRLQNTHTASFWVSCCEDDGGCGAQATGQFFPGPNRRTRFVYNPEAPEGSTFEARTLGELPPEYRRAAKSAIAAWNRRANVAHATAARDAEIEALRAEVERLRTDLMESDEIREKLGHLLTRTAAALKGVPPAGVWHSWHDLPEKAAQLAEALRKLEEREQSDEALLRQALEALSRAHQTAMVQTLKARIPECAEFGGIAQDLDFVVAALRERLGDGAEP